MFTDCKVLTTPMRGYNVTESGAGTVTNVYCKLQGNDQKKKKVKKEAELITLRKARRGNQIKHSKPQKAEKEWKKKSNKEQH